MPLTKEFTFPSDEELNVDEVNLSISALRAGALHLGKYCEDKNNEYVLCKNELKDPRKCLKEGREVTECTMDFFRKVKKHCYKEFNQFSNCLFKSSRNLSFKPCKNTQAMFDKCVLDELGIEKPPFGWQAEPHIHHSDRPRPEPEITHYPDAARELPSDKTTPQRPKYGGVGWLF